MELRKLSDDFFVTAQIRPEDIDAIKSAGIKTIICNRPDGEDRAQPEFAAVAQAASSAGIEIHSAPVVSGQLQQSNITEFDALYTDAQKPVLAYCRSGTRCTVLWTINNPDGFSRDELTERTMKAGYDMRGIIGRD